MNIIDKNTLWTKYFLTEDRHNLTSLRQFVIHEVDVMDLTKKVSVDKKKKFLRYMLKSLSKRDIVKTYTEDVILSPFRKTFLQYSKHDIIDKIIKSTTIWDEKWHI